MAKLVLFLVLACLQGVRLRSVQKRETFSNPISVKPYPGSVTTSEVGGHIANENGVINYNVDSNGYENHYANAEEYFYDTSVTDIIDPEDLDKGDDNSDSDEYDSEEIDDISAEDYNENSEFGSHNMDDNEEDNLYDSDGFGNYNSNDDDNNNNNYEVYKEEKNI